MNKFASMPIETEAEQQLTNYFANVNKLRMCIGVSGGADSMCLMHVLNKLGVKLDVLHVNYQKRGAASAKDAELVRNTANELGIECEIITVDPGEGSDKNFQQWAREVRYQALELKANHTGVDAISVAHHQDDQIETILQKIFRGGGMGSWSAMQVWDGKIFRPLLHMTREQIETYCHKQSILYRDDESNFHSDFARNFLRNDWLPELESHFPGWRKNVLRIGEQGTIFELSLNYILNDISDDKDRLYRDEFLQIDEQLQKSLIIYYASQIDPDQEISRSALGELKNLQSLQTGKGIQLTQSMQLIRDREYFKLVVETKNDSAVFLTIEKEQLIKQPVSLNNVTLQIDIFNKPDYEKKLYLNVDSISWPIRIRPWRDGDRFQPLGMDGHQTVADHLTNRKVSAVYKDAALVIESFEETICAVIFPPIENRLPPGTISERVKCSSSTRKSLIINRSN